MRVVANLSFDGYRKGEVLDADPVLCARYLAHGWLSPVDEGGRRIIELTSDDVHDYVRDVKVGLPPMPSPVARGGIVYDRSVDFTGDAQEAIADNPHRWLALARDDPRRIEAERILKERSG